MRFRSAPVRVELGNIDTVGGARANCCRCAHVLLLLARRVAQPRFDAARVDGGGHQGERGRGERRV